MAGPRYEHSLVVSTTAWERPTSRPLEAILLRRPVTPRLQSKVLKTMRNSLRHCALVVIAAVGVASISTGCRSGGWSMPGSSWVSWGKKKPPASSIAGTREPMQPPSISVPPYPPDDSSSSSATATAMASYPSTSPQGTAPSGYGPMAPGSSGMDSAVPTAAGTTGYATGPYGTGGRGSAMTQTQQGFYRTSTPDGGGPVASTADARGGYSPAMTPSYSDATSNSGYPTPSTYGATPYGADSPPPGGNYAPVTTPGTNYGAPDYGTTNYGYPAPAPNGAYPTTPPTMAYPPTAAGNGYPVTRSDPVAPPGATGGYPANATAPITYGATPYPAGPSSYGDATSTYGASSQNGSYGASATTGSAYGTDSGYGAPTGATTGTSGTSGGYRPGSTSRNNGLLGPTTGTTTSTPGSTYPSTYSR
jgi:hypothetical protein